MIIRHAIALTFLALPSIANAQFERLDPRFNALIPANAVVEELADGIEWAEGPVWDAKAGALLLSDVPRDVILRWKDGEGLTRFLERSGYSGTAPFTGREPGSNGLAFDAEGRLLMCQHGDRRIARREADGRIVAIAERWEGKRFNSPNDLVYGPNGDLYFTDPPYGLPRDAVREIDFTGVYRVSPSGVVTLVTRDLNAPNGIGFSPDGKTLYVANSGRSRAVWMAYPVRADGSVGEGREFARATVIGPGSQDGLKVDAQGNLFATGPGGVHVIAPDGTLLGRILTGQPTGNVGWGDDGSVLYIAANHKLLRVRTSTRGMPPFQSPRNRKPEPVP